MTSHPTQFRSAAPSFPVPDVDRTVSWYQTTLDFQLTTAIRGHGAGQDDDSEDEHHEHTGPLVFAMVERDGVVLMLITSTEPVRPNREVLGATGALDLYIWLADAEAVYALHQQCLARGAVVLEAPYETPYDMVEVAIADCDGRKLVFGA